MAPHFYWNPRGFLYLCFQLAAVLAET